MKYLLIACCNILCFFIVSVSFAGYSREVSNPVVLEYGNIKLTKSQVDKKLSSFLGDNANSHASYHTQDRRTDAMLQQMVLKDLINSEIKQSKFEERSDIQEKANKVKDHLLEQEYLATEAYKNIDENVLRDHYLKIVEQIQNQKEVKLGYITVSNKKQANMIFKKLQHFSFERLQQQYTNAEYDNSQYITLDLLDQHLANNVKQLNINGVSEPIYHKKQYYIIKLYDMRNIPIPTFEEVKEEIETSLLYQFISSFKQQLLENAHYVNHSLR